MWVVDMDISRTPDASALVWLECWQCLQKMSSVAFCTHTLLRPISYRDRLNRPPGSAVYNDPASLVQLYAIITPGFCSAVAFLLQSEDHLSPACLCANVFVISSSLALVRIPGSKPCKDLATDKRSLSKHGLWISVISIYHVHIYLSVYNGRLDGSCLIRDLATWGCPGPWREETVALPTHFGWL